MPIQAGVRPDHRLQQKLREMARSAALTCRAQAESHRQAFELFLLGFLVLFLELACIRWFAAYVVFLQFFTNIVLVAAFLGVSCGCLAARRRRNWLNYFPMIGLASICAALLTFLVYHVWGGLTIDVGGQASQQEVFFGTEYRSRDLAQFVVPIEAVAAIFFVLIALMFVGLGQLLGRAFDAYPERISGYTLNIGGSLAGILVFTAISFCQAPPWVWFAAGCSGVAYFLHKDGALTLQRTATLVLLIAVAAAGPGWMRRGQEIRWSPYYMIDRNVISNEITVNTIGHQRVVPFATSGSTYSLIHLLQQHAGGAPFRDVLIIGAGTGNDVAHALRFGAGHIDAVEIDPVIQEIGDRHHPDEPYQDPRVTVHLDDGRHFLRTTERKYDLVVYALVDSLVLHSGYANLRLESYLFTRQAFADVERVLKPGGLFVTYNFFRQGWIVERIAAMAETAFARPPIVLGLPYVPTLDASSKAGFMMIVAGDNRQIGQAFARQESFWLDVVPPRNLGMDGFAVDAASLASEQRQRYERIAPTTLLEDRGKLVATSDDWPFLYLRGRLIPDLTIRATLLLGVLAAGMVYLFLPKSLAPQSLLPWGRVAISRRMFFLGAGFMLLETKAVVQMALLFGSTWLVNSLVFFTVLVLILLANLLAARAPGIKLLWCYAGLVLLLAAGILIPPTQLLTEAGVWRYAVPCLLALGPIFFAGIIFAVSFRDAPNPDQAFGSNVWGCVLGALSESLVTVEGFRYLALLAMAFYLHSAWPSRGRLRFR